MLHHKCGARCPAYDGCSVCVCPSVRYESGNYNLKCVSLRVDENGAVEYKKKGGSAALHWAVTCGWHGKSSFPHLT